MNESPENKPPQDFLGWLGLANPPNWSTARPLGAILGGLLVLAVPALFLGALVAAGAVLWHTISLALSNGTEGINLGAGALIAALLGAPFVIWGTVLKWQTVRYQKEGHMTDRISKAVEQLGAEKTVKKDGKEETVPNLEVRMGAILSLERIAQDSTMHDKGRDHVMVMQILCEYIRENSNARKPKEHDLGEWKPLKDDATPEELKAHLEALGKRTDAIQEWASTLPKPRADVQLALKVLGRRSAQQRRVEAAWPNPPDTNTHWPFCPDFKRLPDEPGEEATSIEQIESFMAGLEAWKEFCSNYRGYRLDLRGANLQGADMAAGQPDGSDAVFSGVDLGEARMEGASLDRARMEGASFFRARMEGASLIGARMEWAGLVGARMEGASLDWARMEGASLNGARMEGARLDRARMEGARLDRARMEGASLNGARMEGASLDGARMEGTSLVWARMEGTSFSGARMEGASLRETTLTDATSLTPDKLATTFGDSSVVLPEGISPPAHWPRHELDWEDFFTELRRWRASPSTYTPPE